MTAHHSSRPVTRRDALRSMGAGFGMAALAGVVGSSLEAAGTGAIDSTRPLQVKPPHFAPRAKNLIYLFLNGGISQIDSFDYKPMLDKYDGKPLPYETPKSQFATGNLMRSPFRFKQYGQSGAWVSEIFPRLAEIIDDICVVRSVRTDIPNHGPALMMMNTGHNLPGRPSAGSWVTYGLGTENRSLPGFIALAPNGPVLGGRLWNSAFLPAVYQGTLISDKETDPEKQILYLKNKQLSLSQQRRQLDLLAKLSDLHAKRRQEKDPELEACIQSMEIAFRMQTEAPDVFDLSKESSATRKRYGDGHFSNGCLMARRLVEKGVRVVQVYAGSKSNPWDNHSDINGHRYLAEQSDGPMAALIIDLKERGLLDETLVMIGSEFGRTPVVHIGGAAEVQTGRDHNIHGFTYLLAGGGVKSGMTYGATDDFGFKVVENPVHVHDLHATMLHLLGLDHTKLTYHYSGRDFRLTDVHGRVVEDIIA